MHFIPVKTTTETTIAYNRKFYGELCRQHDMPLMARAHWMQATALQKDWTAIIVWKDESAASTVENIAAAMPIHLWKRWGLKRVLMPQLTMLSAVYVAEGVSEEKVLPRLIQALDDFCLQNGYISCYLQGEWPTVFCAAAEQQGFELAQRVTYRIHPPENRQDLHSLFSENKRRQLKRATNLQLAELTVPEFYQFHCDCLAQRGRKINYTAAFAESLLTTLLQHDEARLMGARGAEGNLLAAVALVYDAERCFYLLPCYWQPESKSGAMAWLTSECMAWAASQNLEFDFEGSMIPSIARSYREFGGRECIYHSVRKVYKPFVSKIIFKQ